MDEYVDANRKRRCVSGKMKLEVMAKRRKLLADREAGVAFDSEGLTVEQYRDRWLGSISDKLRLRTLRPYEAG
jgi:hypothetical protein